VPLILEEGPIEDLLLGLDCSLIELNRLKEAKEVLDKFISLYPDERFSLLAL